MVDFKEAEAFLSVLGGEEFTFQTFTDNKDKKSTQKFDPLACVLTGTFLEHKQILSELSAQGAGIYVQINGGLGRGKKFIKDVRAVFVDIDSPDSSKQSMQSIQKFMPKPSMVVKSSPGKFHVYWRTSDCPLELFPKFQQSMAITFYTDDAIKNLDRVMRVPGFPHQKGEPQEVKLLMHSDAHYKINELRVAAGKAPSLTPVEIAENKTTGKKDVFGLDMPVGHIPLTELKDGERVVSAVREIGYQISQGYSVEEVRANIQKLNTVSPVPLSVSELENEVFPCLAGFAKKRDDDITEMRKVRDEGRVEKKKQAHQIPQPPAEMPSVDPAPPAPSADPVEKEVHTLGKWIERFRFVDLGSRVIDTTKNGIHAENSLSDFKNKYTNVRLNNKATLHSKWFQHPLRKDVRDTIFYPTSQKEIKYQGEVMWNIYTPSDINPVEKYDQKKIQPFLDHIEYMFPGKIQQKIILEWMAMTIRRPEIKIPWAPLLISQQGVGKGFLYKTLEVLLGAHNCAMILPDRFDNQFNGYMESLVICVDEMKHNSRQSTADKMKSYVSETTVEINKKGIGESTREVFGNFIFFTNHSDATFLEDSDRRFWVYKITANKAHPEYYDRLWKWLREEAQSVNHLLRFFLDMDLSGYDYATVPLATEAKLEMVDSSKSHIELEVQDAIANRDGVFKADIIGYTTFKDYVELKEGYITKAADGRLKHIWGKLFKPLPNAKTGITPNAEVVNTRQRVRCIRNFEHWSSVSLEEIKYELTRSIQMATGAQSVLSARKPKLVSGDKDAKSNSS